MIDVHNHLLPGVDDGAQSVAESMDAFAAFRAAGVTRLATTPHLDGSLTVRGAAYHQRLEQFDRAWQQLCDTLAEDHARLLRGAEVRLDAPEPDLSDPRIRLNGTKFVLVEFPMMSIPPRSVEAIERIRAQGWIPIVAHPERYHSAVRMLPTIEDWRRAGAYLQVNCGSLLGRYGDGALAAGRALIGRGLADLLASDYHARGRLPITDCARHIEELGGAEQAALLLGTNPGRILEDQPPLPVPPLSLRPGFWRRLAHVFR